MLPVVSYPSLVVKGTNRKRTDENYNYSVKVTAEVWHVSHDISLNSEVRSTQQVFFKAAKAAISDKWKYCSDQQTKFSIYEHENQINKVNNSNNTVVQRNSGIKLFVMKSSNFIQLCLSFNLEIFFLTWSHKQFYPFSSTSWIISSMLNCFLICLKKFYLLKVKKLWQTFQ